MPCLLYWRESCNRMMLGWTQGSGYSGSVVCNPHAEKKTDCLFNKILLICCCIGRLPFLNQDGFVVLSHFGWFISQVSILQMLLPILAANFHQNQAMMSRDPPFFSEIWGAPKTSKGSAKVHIQWGPTKSWPKSRISWPVGGVGPEGLGMEAIRLTSW